MYATLDDVTPPFEFKCMRKNVVSHVLRKKTTGIIKYNGDSIVSHIKQPPSEKYDG